MQNVPNIVRERLKAAAPAVNHPDADVLTAFSERSLPELERATVLEHLARCADCREIASLALPPTEVSHTVIVPYRTGWLAWPALRWGFVAAGVILVATLGVLQYRRGAHSTMMASRQAEQAPAAVEPEAQKKATDITSQQGQAVARFDEAQPARNGVGAAAPAADKSAASPKPSSPASSAMLAKAENAVRGLTPHGAFTYGPKLALQQQQNTNANQAQAAPPAAASPAAKQAGANVAAAASPISMDGAVAQKELASNEQAAQELRSLTNAPISEPSGNYGSGELKIDRAKPAETTVHIDDGVPRTVAGGAPFQAPVRAGRALAAPRWTITSSGALQRSFDQGNTWQDVNVSNRAGGDSYHGAAASLDLAAKTSTAKAKDLERDSKGDAPNLTFRAVVANGTDVWAGGSAGMLYHSVDSGMTWVRVVPSSSRVDLSGDIISIQFSDGTHGRVVTSTSEVWLTSDAGQTWQKQ